MTVDRKADVLCQDNFAPAFYNLANCYRKGFGIYANKERADALKKRAAELEAGCKEEIVKVTAKQKDSVCFRCVRYEFDWQSERLIQI